MEFTSKVFSQINLNKNSHGMKSVYRPTTLYQRIPGTIHHCHQIQILWPPWANKWVQQSPAAVIRPPAEQENIIQVLEKVGWMLCKSNIVKSQLWIAIQKLDSGLQWFYCEYPSDSNFIAHPSWVISLPIHDSWIINPLWADYISHVATVSCIWNASFFHRPHCCTFW